MKAGHPPRAALSSRTPKRCFAVCDFAVACSVLLAVFAVFVVFLIGGDTGLFATLGIGGICEVAAFAAAVVRSVKTDVLVVFVDSVVFAGAFVDLDGDVDCCCPLEAADFEAKRDRNRKVVLSLRRFAFSSSSSSSSSTLFFFLIASLSKSFKAFSLC